MQAPTAINYIWDTRAPVGSLGDYRIPFVIHVKTVVVARGTAGAGTWQVVRRDVGDDYQRFFGRRAPAVSAVRFQANSQHTRSVARGCLRELSFSPRSPPPP